MFWVNILIKEECVNSIVCPRLISSHSYLTVCGGLRGYSGWHVFILNKEEKPCKSCEAHCKHENQSDNWVYVRRKASWILRGIFLSTKIIVAFELLSNNWRPTWSTSTFYIYLVVQHLPGRSTYPSYDVSYDVSYDIYLNSSSTSEISGCWTNKKTKGTFRVGALTKPTQIDARHRTIYALTGWKPGGSSIFLSIFNFQVFKFTLARNLKLCGWLWTFEFFFSNFQIYNAVW